MVQHGRYLEIELSASSSQRVSPVWDKVIDLGTMNVKWILEAVGDIISITKISFSGGSASSNVGGPPLTCKIEGKVVSEDIDINLSWKPDFDIVKFIKPSSASCGRRSRKLSASCSRGLPSSSRRMLRRSSSSLKTWAEPL